MRAHRGLVICLLALAFGGAGCAETKEEDATPGTTTEATQTTPEEVRSNVWERAYTECAGGSNKALAAKYRVDETPAAISAAVSASWRDRFDAGNDALPSGVEGCLQGMKSR